MALKPKSVLCALPTFCLDPDPDHFLATWEGVLNEFWMRGWKVNTIHPYRRPIVQAENQIAQVAITNGIDYIFRMDDDIWGFQPGYINKLIDADVDYISGVMYITGFPYSLCAFTKKDEFKDKNLVEIFKYKMLALSEVEGHGVQQCDMVGTPFTLMKTEIFEKILMPYYAENQDAPPDSCFCQKLLDAGIHPHVHMDVKLNHRHVTFWNRHYLYNADARVLLQTNSMDKKSELFTTLAKEFGEDGKKDMMQLKGIKILDVSGSAPNVRNVIQ
jgi:hypothetical protein